MIFTGCLDLLCSSPLELNFITTTDVRALLCIGHSDEKSIIASMIFR